MNHFVAIVLLSSVGIRCLTAEPCARLYMQGLYATNYPQLAGVYVLQTALRGEMWNGFPVYQHELDELYVYYNSSEDSLMIGPRDSNCLLRVKKRSVVDISSDVNYSMDQLFDFLSWKQWDPLQNKFLEIRANSVIKPICVDRNFGFCSSGILYPNVSDTGPRDTVPNTALDVRKIRFKLRPGAFYNVRPVYELVGDTETVPYYLYHENGKWQLGTEVGAKSSRGIILEMESHVMRVEYERHSEWRVVSSDSRQRSAIHHLQCSRQVLDVVDCQSAATDICENGGSCHVDSAGISSCICTPDFTGIHCEKPVAKCKQTFSSDSPSFAFSNREGSVMSVFCPSGRVLVSVCDGFQWWPHGSVGCPEVPTAASLVLSSLLPENSSATEEDSSEFIGPDPAGKIALVIASLVGLQLLLPFVCYCCISCCKFDENKLNIEEKPLALKGSTKFLRACSVFLYVSWWAWFGFLIYYLCMWHGHIALDGTTIWSAVAIMAIIFVCLLYIVVLCESVCSLEYEYLTKLKDMLLAEEQISQMKLELPSIKFKADCWHPETRTRTIHDGSGQDGNGMHTEMCTVHVPTAAVEEMFSYNDCVDISGNFLLPTSNAAVTQVHVDLDVEFADEVSRCIYDEAFDLFKNSHTGRDQQVDFSVEYNLPSYVKELAIRDPNKHWMSSSHFILATCLCLTWPYRWLLNSSKNEYHYRVVKKVTVSPARQEPAVPTGHPALIDISNEEHPSLAAVPSIPVPLTPPPPYEE